MSTRYVWDKCSISYTESVKEINSNTSGIEGGLKLYGSNTPNSGTFVGYASTGYTKNSDGTYNLSGTIIELVLFNRITDQSYKYMAFSRTNNNWIVYIKYWRSSTMHICGSFLNKNSKYWLCLAWEDTSAPFQIIYEDLYSRTVEAGSMIQRLSGVTSTAYPTGQSGDYWYSYKGSDSIDPTAVSYSNTEPRAGETITVTVTPAKNLYGGTVSYQYQYAVNGGAWTNSGGKTTSVTKELTVPNGSAQFRVRAIASDDLGFTSTTYVYGANLPVVNMRAYLGINGAARRVEKMYVGISGKARKVSKAYIGGADGKARLLF